MQAINRPPQEPAQPQQPSSPPQSPSPSLLQEQEWPSSDPRWQCPPQLPPHSLAKTRPEARPLFPRSQCPITPLGNHLVLWAKGVKFFTESGLALTPEKQTLRQAEAPILTVIAVGPDVKEFLPGDLVVMNPNNLEVVYEWLDPNSPHTSFSLILVCEDSLIGRLDGEVVEQLVIRADRFDKGELVKENRCESRQRGDLTLPPAAGRIVHP